MTRLHLTKPASTPGTTVTSSLPSMSPLRACRLMGRWRRAASTDRPDLTSLVAVDMTQELRMDGLQNQGS